MFEILIQEPKLLLPVNRENITICLTAYISSLCKLLLCVKQWLLTHLLTSHAVFPRLQHTTTNMMLRGYSSVGWCVHYVTA